MANILIIIPAFNEGIIIGKVIQSLPKKLFGFKTDVLVIDDGSTDNTYKITQKYKIKVIQHLINRGLGASIATGFRFALKHNYDFVVTFDADGQHVPQDISKALEPLLMGKADVVIGSRLIKYSNMPLFRKLVNYLSNITTFLLFNIWTTDSQSGLRVFTNKAIKRMDIRSQRMEVSSEIFKEINRLKLKMIEVPIKTIYTDYSLKKGQSLDNAPRVLWKLIQHIFS